MSRYSLPAFVFGLTAAILLLAAPIRSASDSETAAWCGTWDWGIEVALARHELNRRQADRRFVAQSSESQSLDATAIATEANGNVAVIRDDGTLIIDQNVFDYETRAVKFLRRGRNGYRVRNFSGSVNENLGERLDLGDDDSMRIDLPGFAIRYFGKSYDSVFVNSDGNLSFGESDVASTERDIQRLLNGPPRVAPFFADLNPQAAVGDGGVYLRLTPNKIIVTWWKVPEFGRTGNNTFQVTMNKRGNVDVRFGGMVAREGIVGVAPGGGGGLELMDLTSDLPIKRKGIAIAERFTEEESLDEASVAAAFYDSFVDDYDQLVMFTDFGRQAGEGAIAYHLTVKNRVRGLGKPVYDGSRFFGSNGRLEGFVNMGGQSQYSSNVNRPSFWNLYSATDILAHELGHQWLVGVTFIDAQGMESDDLLGRGNAHWSFYFDSDLSFLEGNEISDDGGGLFSTRSRRATYNPFDRYLMGLIPASEVPPKFYVRLTSGSVNPDNAPAKPGETFAGNRVDVSLDQIIAAIGPRNPTVADSPKTFRIGFIVLVEQGKQVQSSTVNKVNQIATEIERLFRRETGGLGTLDTTLIGR